MRDPDWASGAPCYAFIATGTRYRADCEGTWRAPYSRPWVAESVALAEAAARVLGGWALDVANLAFAGESSSDSVRCRCSGTELLPSWLWLTEHLSIETAEAALIHELAMTMKQVCGDVQPAVALANAWRALRIAAGDL